jgi:hypothetical protein
LDLSVFKEMSWVWSGVNTLIALLLFRWAPPSRRPGWPALSEIVTVGAILVVTAIITAEVISFVHRRSSAGLQTVIGFSLGGMLAWLVSYLSHRHNRAQ